MPAVAALHEMGAEIAHGTLSPDRIIVTPTGDLVVTEYVFAHALERLDATPADLWRELGVAVSPSAGRPDQRGDIEQVALLALAVLLGRPLGPDEYPRKVRQLLDEACDAKRWSLVPPLRTWLTRALALTSSPFSSAIEALDTLDQLLPRVSGMWAARLLPQNVTPPAASPSAPGPSARGPSAPNLPAPAPLPAKDARQPAQDAARPDRPEPARAVPEPASRPSSPALPSVLFGTAEATPQSRAVEVASAKTDTDRRLWLLCGGLTAVAVLEALCLVIVLGGQRFAGPESGIPSGAASTLPFAAAGAPASGALAGGEGWLTIESPVRIEVHVDNRLMGTGTDLRFALPSGRHEVSLTSGPLGFRSTQRIDLAPGGLIRLRPDVQTR
jgi:hypothetical protein